MAHVRACVPAVLAFHAQISTQKSDVDSDDQEFEIQRKEWVLKVAKYSLNNFQDFAADIYASHILKTSFQVSYTFRNY